jgi:signal transduction histidine kinase
VILSPKPLFAPDGDFIGSFAVVTDITALKTIEAALRGSEQKLRLVSEHLLLARERERERISRELHDELGQDLTVLKHRTRFIERKLRKDQKVLKEACAEIIQHLDKIMENTRRISKDLSPALLEDLGLTASLRRLVEDTGKHSPTQVISDIHDIDSLLPKEVQVNLYRIVQEALNNAMKHAGASRAWVSVKRDGSRIVCLVTDDGRGCNLQEASTKASPSGGLGLPIMEERARMIGGKLLIRSHPTTGTEVRLVVPVMLDEEK